MSGLLSCLAKTGPPGPSVARMQLTSRPSATVSTQSKSIDLTGWQIDTEMARRLAPLADPFVSEEIRVEPEKRQLICS
jgi:hypothetical protein